MPTGGGGHRLLRWGCALKRGRIAGSEGEMSSCLQKKGDLSFFFFFKSHNAEQAPFVPGRYAKRTVLGKENHLHISGAAGRGQKK